MEFLPAMPGGLKGDSSESTDSGTDTGEADHGRGLQGAVLHRARSGHLGGRAHAVGRRAGIPLSPVARGRGAAQRGHRPADQPAEPGPEEPGRTQAMTAATLKATELLLIPAPRSRRRTPTFARTASSRWTG